MIPCKFLLTTCSLTSRTHIHVKQTLFSSQENPHESHVRIEINRTNTTIEQSTVRKKISNGNYPICLSVCVSVH